MAQVEFTTEGRLITRESLGGLSGWFVRRGWVKNQAQANLALLVASVVIALLAVLVYIFGSPDTSTPEVDYSEIPQFLPIEA